MWHHLPCAAASSITEAQLQIWAGQLAGAPTKQMDMRDGVVASRLLSAVLPCIQQSMVQHIEADPFYGKLIKHNWEIVHAFLRQLEVPSNACDVSGIRSNRTAAVAVFQAVLYCLSHCNEVEPAVGFGAMFSFAVPMAVMHWLRGGYLRSAALGGCGPPRDPASPLLQLTQKQ